MHALLRAVYERARGRIELSTPLRFVLWRKNVRRVHVLELIERYHRALSEVARFIAWRTWTRVSKYESVRVEVFLERDDVFAAHTHLEVAAKRRRWRWRRDSVQR